MVGYSADEYLLFAANKKTIYYSEPVCAYKGSYVLPTNGNPEQWEVRSDGHWTYANCRMYSFPSQGWKIHITTTISDAQNVLHDVAEYLFAKSISFKYLSSRDLLIQVNGKYADRLESGKFITIYPSSEDVFVQLLKDLKTIVCKYDDGPYVLTDKQWQNSNVFFRYGALKPRFSNNENMPTIMTPQGDLIPDKKVPVYSLPFFIDEPVYVKVNNYFTEYSNGKLGIYQIDSAVHFSNNGGVYIAYRNDEKYILKEGRKNVGISDRSCMDAFHRVKHEYQILRSLSSLSDVVNAVDCFDVWNHVFLVEEFFEGRDLQQYIAMDFPFDGCSARTDCTDSYWRRCKDIATKLETAIEKIHKSGFAVGDLSLSNVLVNDSLEIKLIDFEAAKKLSQDFQVDIATPGFTNDAVRDYEQQDWYAFTVIVHRLFVPICPLYYLAPSLLFCQDYMVQKHFGNEAVSFLRTVRSRMLGLAPLLSHGPFIDKALQACGTFLSPKNTDVFVKLLYKGIISDLDYQGEDPVKGDISMYGNEMSRCNVISGSAGVSLALLKSSYSGNSEWFHAVMRKQYVSILQELEDDTSFCVGLFNGAAGIAMVAHEVLSHEACHKILSHIGASHIDRLTDIGDYSLYSGLSGIGMALLSLGVSRNTHEEKILSYILSNVYERCACGSTSEDILSSKADFTLMKGWLGAGLFLWKASLCRKDDALRSCAESIFRLTLTHLVNVDNKERPIYYVDYLKNKPRTMPYLDCGTSGVALAFIEVYKDGNDSMEFLNEEFLKRLSLGSDMVCTFNGGLFGGYAGLLPAAIALRDLGIDDGLWKRIIDGLNLYLMKNNGSIVFPGLYGYKCSMDLGTGSAGVLLALSDSERSGEWGSWMPVLKNGDFSLFCV